MRSESRSGVGGPPKPARGSATASARRPRSARSRSPWPRPWAGGSRPRRRRRVGGARRSVPSEQLDARRCARSHAPPAVEHDGAVALDEHPEARSQRGDDRRPGGAESAPGSERAGQRAGAERNDFATAQALPIPAWERVDRLTAAARAGGIRVRRRAPASTCARARRGRSRRRDSCGCSRARPRCRAIRRWRCRGSRPSR